MQTGSQSNRTLVTGFGPFLQIRENPSGVLARESGRPHKVLEVSFEAVDTFLANVDATRYDRLLLIGVAAGRSHLTPELYARNRIGHVPDVRGNDRAGLIEPDAPMLLLSSLWHPHTASAIFPEPRLRMSCNAGDYLCNYTLFRALRALPELSVGFLHVPMPSELSLDLQIPVLRKLLDMVETEAHATVR